MLSVTGPMLPGVTDDRIFAVGGEEFCELAALLLREARADADVVQRAGFVEKAEQERADSRPLTVLVPSKAGNHAIAVALVLDLEHHAFIRLVYTKNRLGHDAVESRAFESA